MNKFLFLFSIITLAFAHQSLAQDEIIKHSGNVIKADIIEITPHEVKYTRFADRDKPSPVVFTIYKSEILSIRYEDGTTEIIQASRPAVTSTRSRYKSPGLAFALSFLVPGGGEFYVGEYAIGGGFIGGYLLGWILYGVGNDPYSYGVTGLEGTGIALVVGSSLGSMIHAPLAAVKYNRNGPTAGLISFGNENYQVGIDPLSGPGLGGSMRVRF